MKFKRHKKADLFASPGEEIRKRADTLFTRNRRQ